MQIKTQKVRHNDGTVEEFKIKCFVAGEEAKIEEAISELHPDKADEILDAVEAGPEGMLAAHAETQED